MASHSSAFDEAVAMCDSGEASTAATASSLLYPSSVATVEVFMQDKLKTAANEPVGDLNGRLDQKWAEAAVRCELEAIGRLHGDNPHRPDSEFWACLIRMASVIKGAGRRHISPSTVLTAVLSHAPDSLRTKGDRDKDISYLFGRAMNMAKPRYRSIR